MREVYARIDMRPYDRVTLSVRVRLSAHVVNPATEERHGRDKPRHAPQIHHRGASSYRLEGGGQYDTAEKHHCTRPTVREKLLFRLRWHSLEYLGLSSR